MKPWRLHRGVVRARGAWLCAPVPAGALRARVLDGWLPGDHVRQLDDGTLLVLWREPRAMAVIAAPGMPLVEQHGVLGAMVIDAGRARTLGLPAGAVVVPWHGEERVILPGEGVPVDPAAWLEPGDATVLQLESLAPRVATQLDEHRSRDPLTIAGRDEAGVVAQRRAVAQAFNAVTNAESPPTTRSAAPWRERVADWWSSLKRALAAPPAAAPSRLPVRVAADPPAEPSALRRFLERLLRETRLVDLVGRMHARYLARMLDLFEQGDLSEALKHAIPVSNTPGSGASSSLPLMPFRPRAQLQLSPRGAPGGASLGASAALLDHLRRLYRRAFETLRAQGRVDEAAFVLAELLDAPDEAVAYLEQEGRLETAAELAESRLLPPARVVRQWMVAGRPDRAVEVARARGAFGEAVTLLEKNHAALARALRVLWADVLAEAGDFSGAAALLHGSPGMEALVERWLDEAVSRGGTGAARAHALSLVPPAQPRVDGAIALLSSSEPADREAQRALVQALLPLDGPLVAGVARRAIRVAAGYLEAGEPGWDRKDVLRLVARSQDRVIAEDLPPLPAQVTGWPASGKRAWGLDGTDRGTLGLLDALPLSRGRVALALGEAGIRVVDHAGETLFHLDQPADHLVACDQADRCLAMAVRAGMHRVARVDFHARRAHPWLLLSLESWADTYDGSTWFVAMNGDVLALDAANDARRVLWRVDRVGAVSMIQRDPASLAFVAGSPERALWRYELPALALRDRVEGDALRGLVAMGANAERVRLEAAPDPNVVHVHWGTRVVGTVPTDARLRVAANGAWCAAVAVHATATHAWLHHADHGERLAIQWRGNVDAWPRMAGRRAIFTGRHGVAELVDLDTGRSRSVRT